MSAETQQALEEATGYYRATGDAVALQEAAQSHLAASPDLQETAAQYKALQDLRAAGEPYDAAAMDSLGTELTFLAQATAYAAGNLPGTGHTAAAGIGA